MSIILQLHPEQTCAHCGTPHKQGNRYVAIQNGETKSMCCPACVIVAEMLEQCRKIEASSN